MVQEEFVVPNPLGLHARSAAKLVAVTSRFRSRVLLHRPDKDEAIDGKSILGILMMAASKGTHLVFQIEGPDEEAAMDSVRSLFSDNF